MDMNISTISRTTDSQKINRTASLDKDSQKTKGQTYENPTDKYTPSEKEKNINYERPSHQINQQMIDRLKAESDQHYHQLRQLVSQLLEKQGMTFNDLKNDNITVKVDEETKVEAQNAISENGPLSPEKVSDRIVNFAKALANGDQGKMEMLTKAINDGFQAAADAFGGELPAISHETHDLVMEKLDQWARETSA